MLIKVKRGWDIPERLATPEYVFFNRRRFLATGAAVGAMSVLSACDDKQEAQAQANAAPAAPDPSATLYPFKRNETYKLDRGVTDEQWSTNYNNYYEFSSGKHLTEEAQALPIRPWVLTIDGQRKLVVLGLEHQVQGVEHRPFHVPVEVMGLQIQRVGVGQQLAEAVRDGLAVFFRYADVDVHGATCPIEGSGIIARPSIRQQAV
jgi:hypothetical protein